MPAEHVQVWEWDDANNIWVKKPAVVAPVRLVAVGQVAPGAHKLCWLACTPTAGNSVWELTDAIAGGGAVVIECFSTAKESKGFVFSPPMPFATGIYLETFTNMAACTFGYI